MLKLKLQYFGHLMWRTDSLEKILMLGKIEGRRRRGRKRMRWLDGITDLMDMNLSKLQELVMDREALVHCSPWVHRVRHNWVSELNWTVHLAQKSIWKALPKIKRETELSFKHRTHSCHLILPYTLPSEACVQSHSSHLVNTWQDHQRPVICKNDESHSLTQVKHTCYGTSTVLCQQDLAPGVKGPDSCSPGSQTWVGRMQIRITLQNFLLEHTLLNLATRL